MTVTHTAPDEPTVVERASIPAATEIPRFLEGRLAYPERRAPRSGVVLLPPHPHFAGDLDNNIVRALGLGLGARGHAALAFNYRGIGASEINPRDLAPGPDGGSIHDYWQRVESEARYPEITADAEAARRYLVRALPAGTPVHLVGYSFGAALAALLARDLVSSVGDSGGSGGSSDSSEPGSPPASVTLIAPPIRRYPLPFLADLPLPRLLLLASGDFLYSDEEIEQLRRLPPPRQVHVIDGADHFFRGRESETVEHVERFLKEIS